MIIVKINVLACIQLAQNIVVDLTIITLNTTHSLFAQVPLTELFRNSTVRVVLRVDKLNQCFNLTTLTGQSE